jgi:hypothetical protein
MSRWRSLSRLILRESMTQDIAGTDGLAPAVIDRLNDNADGRILNSANSIASRIPMPRGRYAFPDFDGTWIGKFHQMIVDRLHSQGD